MYPRVEIKLESIKHNTKVLVDRCGAAGIKVAAVTKLVCGDITIVNTIINSGVETIADSRLLNLKKIVNLETKKLLLRIPMISELEEVVELIDISLNSEIQTIRKISDIASKKDKVHDIILMVDVGDLREGIINSELLDNTVDEIIKLKYVNLLGIGTNVTCYGGVMPSYKNIHKLIEIKNKIENKYNIKIEVVSGGNSGSLELLSENTMPVGVNQLRLGASILMGIGLNDKKVFGLKYDCFKLVVEIIEIMDKPSVPIGEIGLNAFGEKPVFSDLGIRKKAICAVGRQDVLLEDLIPIDDAITILGMSSDHLILDITDSACNYNLGDKINFDLSYDGVLRVMSSDYIYKIYK